MCFYDDDYDWYAEVVEEASGPSDTPARCDECRKKIAPGEWRRYVFQQEHEECQRCEYEELAEDEELCETHDYGETYHYNCCEACNKVLQSIKAVEVAEGCPPYAQQPAFGTLWENMNEHSSAPIYAAKAIEMFPELGSNEWLLEALTREEESA